MSHNSARVLGVQYKTSDEVRKRITDVIEAAQNGIDTIVTWYHKPVAVVIPYADYIALKQARANEKAPPSPPPDCGKSPDWGPQT